MMKTLSQLLEPMEDGDNPPMSYADLLLKRKADNCKFIDELAANKGKTALELLIGRSGIMPLHKNCTVNNYEAETEQQKTAKQFSFFFAKDFHKNQGQGFIFSGNSRTGKNHLASAICNKLIRDGKSCLVITISELMIKMRKCYGKNAEQSEDEFISSLIKFDFLVLDEIGLQKKNDSEKLLLNQIVDQRVGHLKPTGMLTNLNANDLEDLLGERVMKRMNENGGEWIPFAWGSYKKNK
jgi:DNA replication protein DnaC